MSHNFIKRELSRFSRYFPKFSVQLFQNAQMKKSVDDFSKIMGGKL